jgi:hypothetical protein
MTMIEITLPDELARRAESAGLLSDAAIQQLLEDAIRRRSGHALLEVARHIQNAGIPPMSMDEIDAEVKAVRAAQREAEQRTRTERSPGSEPGEDAGRS